METLLRPRCWAGSAGPPRRVRDPRHCGRGPAAGATRRARPLRRATRGTLGGSASLTRAAARGSAPAPAAPGATRPRLWADPRAAAAARAGRPYPAAGILRVERV